jgi:TonB family protein
MKLSCCLTSLLFALVCNWGMCVSDPESRAVENPVSFSGEFVTFREAKPKFKPVVQSQPEYPQELLERRVEGYAVIAFLVDLDGTTTQCQVVKASDAAFGEAARAAIERWKFSAPTFAGKKGRIAMQFPVEFSLPSQGSTETSAAE